MDRTEGLVWMASDFIRTSRSLRRDGGLTVIGDGYMVQASCMSLLYRSGDSRGPGELCRPVDLFPLSGDPCLL